MYGLLMLAYLKVRVIPLLQVLWRKCFKSPQIFFIFYHSVLGNECCTYGVKVFPSTEGLSLYSTVCVIDKILYILLLNLNFCIMDSKSFWRTVVLLSIAFLGYNDNSVCDTCCDGCFTD